VLMFTNPIARLEDQERTLELHRMVLLDAAPRNSPSRCLAIARRLIRRLYPDVKRLIAYADPGVGHTGTVYRAAGWQYTGKTRGGSWEYRHGRQDRARGPKLKFETRL